MAREERGGEEAGGGGREQGEVIGIDLAAEKRVNA
jgi:hypothetical protein